jgi:hypothetical protein
VLTPKGAVRLEGYGALEQFALTHLTPIVSRSAQPRPSAER